MHAVTSYVPGVCRFKLYEHTHSPLHRHGQAANELLRRCLQPKRLQLGLQFVLHTAKKAKGGQGRQNRRPSFAERLSWLSSKIGRPKTGGMFRMSSQFSRLRRATCGACLGWKSGRHTLPHLLRLRLRCVSHVDWPV